ncbi:hypothetical protein EZV77_19160 [Burkholderia thailandensis]|nr:hypothetical protein [Burkholderia thailandensis]MDD1489546.1 hypothetical protein [Burkholderia thailandensis]MDD1496737.1 hypothetical protein [Burkholderia thailandensis]PJO68343.1 hypothetical protein CWD92_33340 [Burkholderia thailandensis]TBW60334.1 hypothetical protein EZV77_19160 [Burkholderia thailandensis]
MTVPATGSRAPRSSAQRRPGPGADCVVRSDAYGPSVCIRIRRSPCLDAAAGIDRRRAFGRRDAADPDADPHRGFSGEKR